MRETAVRIDVKFAAITLVFAAGILYASLYPFHFADRPGSPLQALLATWSRRPSRSDLLANLLFYVPLGFFLMHVLRRSSRALRVPAVTLLSLAFSFCVEMLQFYASPRVSSMSDVYANGAGACFGALVAAGLQQRAVLRLPRLRHYFVLILLASWLGWRLFPYVPTIDLYQYKSALKPLIFSPALPLPALYRHFVTGLTISALLAEVVGVARSRLLAPALLLAVIGVRVTLSGVVLSPAEVAGGLAAAICWPALVSHLPFRMPLLAALFAVMIAIQSLEPFHFLSVPRPFGWIPFRSFMQGSLSVNVVSFFEKVLTAGSMLWLLVKSGSSLPIATAATGIFVLLLRFCQVFLPGRSAEITDTLIVLILAGLMALLSPSPIRRQPHAQP